MSSEEYLALLRERLLGSYDVEMPGYLGGSRYPLYAKSHVVASKYIFHRSVAYETMEMNEHVICLVASAPPSPAEVASFVDDLKRLVNELVQPSDQHMSSAITGVLISENGFPPETVRKLTRSGFTRHFWLGLRGWCFLRLLGVDLSSGRVWANRRGREVMKAYSPGTEG